MGRGIEIHRGKIRIHFQYRGKRHRETLDLKATPANLKHAERLRAEIVEKIRLGVFDYAEYFPNSKHAGALPANATFQHVGQAWLAVQKADVAPSTYKSYRLALENFWFPQLGDRLIGSIKRSEILKCLTDAGLKSKTRNNKMIPLRGVLEFAYLDDVIDKNPADKIKNAKWQRVPPDPFTIDEVELILSKLAKRSPEQVVNYFEWAFFTGMRPSEIIALQWDDIDWRVGTATVQRARVIGLDKDTTKTHSIRHIELNARALAALKLQRAHSQLPGGAVFLNPETGRAWKDDQSQRKHHWNPALRLLGIRMRVPYQCRHTFATMNLMAGANPMWVAQQLGHVDMTMLLTVYSKWIPKADAGRERSKIEAMLQQSAPDQQRE